MRTIGISLLLAISLCGLLGCAKSKPVETSSAAAELASDQSQEQPQMVKAKPQQIPKVKSASAVKPKERPADTVTVKTSNEVAAPAEPVAHKETKIEPKVEPKEEATESKPAEMKVANGFDRNPSLSSIVKPLLPSRTTMTDAATGFKKQRDFIAALHLSRNLNIPFNQIKTRMTGEHRMSLTDSLRDIRSDMSKNLAKAEVKKAEEQAKDDENRAKDEAKKAADGKLLSASSRK